MRRFLSISFLALALMMSATGAASSAHASSVLDNAADNNAPVSDANGNIGAGNGGSGAATFATGLTADQVAATNLTPIDGKASPAEGYNSVMQWIMSIFAWLVGVAALTLDTAVFYTVVTMGDYVHKLTAIGVAWRILRDIGNIMLIFGFLAIGISIILNTERLGWGKKMLPMLLVAAVFLNFSLFFSEAIIDTGNLFATQFYKQINGGNLPTAAFTASATVKDEGISNKIMAQLGLATLYNVNDGTVTAKIFQGAQLSIIGFLGILLFIITAFVMFSLAFILIARFVVLIFLIILAPIGFAGLAVPQLKHKAGQWWSLLFQQTITAPVLLLLLYVALAVITDAQFLTGFNPTGGTWLGSVGNTNLPGFGGLLLSFLVAMGLLLAVTISAKSLSAFGASKATALAGKLTFGATAWGMRSTAGAGSQAASQWLRRTTFGASKYGRVASMALDKGAKASFDVRGATAFGGLKGMGVVAGDAQKGGYRAKREETIKAHEEYNKSIGKAFDEKGATRKEEKAIADAERARDLAAGVHSGVAVEHAAATQQRDAHQAEVDRLKEELRRDSYLVGDPTYIAKRDAADRNLAASETGLATATAKLAQTAADLDAAQKASAKATKDSGDRLSKEKKEGQLAYAGSINQSPIAWAMYGSGGSKAARNIKAEVGKSSDQKMLDQLKKILNAPPATPPVAGAPATPPPAGGHP